jgi:hypothetical protein
MKTLKDVLIQAIEESGFSVSGPIDSKAAEDGEPIWVCEARRVLSEQKTIDLQAALTEEKTLHLSLDDTTAEKIGLKIAADFGLKKSRENKGRFVTDAGDYNPMGIARRAVRHIEEGIRGLE